MREIKTHYVEGKSVNHFLRAVTDGSENAGGMPTEYLLQYRGDKALVLRFQNGDPRQEVNGVTNEQLIATVIDRLECAQRGPFACADNKEALHDLQDALGRLMARTDRRIAAGTEGTSTPA